MKYLFSTILIILLSAAGFAGIETDSLSVNLPVADSLAVSKNAGVADSVDIKQIVASQINAAKKKEIEGIAPQIEFTGEKKIVVDQNADESLTGKWNRLLETTISPLVDEVYGFISTADDTTLKIAFLGLASLIAMLFVFFRRKVIREKHEKKNSIKDNIRLLREERPVKRSDSRLTGIRNSLVNNSLSYSNSQSGMTRVARELNISKGEVLLASKIKSHELNKNWLGSGRSDSGGRLF